jgi:hypothetical protein
MCVGIARNSISPLLAMTARGDSQNGMDGIKVYFAEL